MDQVEQDVRSRALVTGSGQGIGLAFAEELARRGHNLIMVALPGEQLQKTASAIEQAYGVRVEAVEMDLSEDGSPEAVHRLIHERGFNVNVLINNAGIGSNAVFTDMSPGFYRKQIILNDVVPVLLCRLLIPDMSRLPSAYILNMASMGAYFHMPHKEVYVASKAFLISFSRSLQLSLSDSTVHIMALCPGGVNSNERLREIHKNLKGIGGKAVLETSHVAKEGLDALFRKEKLWVPGSVNRWLLRLNYVMPAFIRDAIVRKEMHRQESLKAIVEGCV
jgi:short-subunit dehydrogenase